jgi:hypothetical protein
MVIPGLDLVVGINGGNYGEFTKWYRWGLQLVLQHIIPALWLCRAQESMPRGTLLRIEHPETVDLRALPSVPSPASSGHHLSLTRGGGEGDKDCEGSTTIFLVGATRDRDFSSSSFDQLFGHPKANARSEIPLCGEKWLEYLRQVLRWNPRAIISNNCLNPVSRGTDNLTNRDAEHPSLSHCIYGIRNNVGENLEDLAFAYLHHRLVMELLVGSDPSSEQFRTIYGKHIFHQLMEVDLCW